MCVTPLLPAESGFVTRLIYVFCVRMILSEAFPDFHSLLFVVQVTVNFDLADDTEQRQNRPAIMMKLVLMDIPVFDVPAMMFWSDTITGTAPKEHSQG